MRFKRIARNIMIVVLAVVCLELPGCAGSSVYVGVAVPGPYTGPTPVVGTPVTMGRPYPQY
jgi:hypothetical protein